MRADLAQQAAQQFTHVRHDCRVQALHTCTHFRTCVPSPHIHAYFTPCAGCPDGGCCAAHPAGSAAGGQPRHLGHGPPDQCARQQGAAQLGLPASICGEGAA
eukprot:351471-Chlamydomonas_euryale.AAC.1